MCQSTRAHRLVVKAGRIGGPALQTPLIMNIFAACMEEGRDISDPFVLADIAARSGLGLSQEELVAFIESDELAKEVQDISSAVRAKGITGVPFVIIDGKWAVSGGQSADVYVQVSKLCCVTGVNGANGATDLQEIGNMSGQRMRQVAATCRAGCILRLGPVQDYVRAIFASCRGFTPSLLGSRVAHNPCDTLFCVFRSPSNPAGSFIANQSLFMILFHSLSLAIFLHPFLLYTGTSSLFRSCISTAHVWLLCPCSMANYLVRPFLSRITSSLSKFKFEGSNRWVLAPAYTR